MNNQKVEVGQIYWLKTESEIAHPHLVVKVEGDIATVCSITTNMKKLSMPGIVVLEAGEGGLEKQSIVELYNAFDINNSKLVSYIGQLGPGSLTKVINIPG